MNLLPSSSKYHKKLAVPNLDSVLSIIFLGKCLALLIKPFTLRWHKIKYDFSSLLSEETSQSITYILVCFLCLNETITKPKAAAPALCQFAPELRLKS